jgi:solute:Na+ symporter, SSS family
VNAAVSLGIMAAVLVGTVTFALFNLRRIATTPQEYILGGRGFGVIFLWVLLGGEIYTSFTFLGASGWAYGFGAPAFYIMCYGSVGYIVGYFLLPAVWRYGKEHHLLTAPDILATRFQSRSLATFASAVYIVAIVPYVTLQLSALQIFLMIAGYGRIDAQTGAILSFLMILAFVFLTGLRGTAWASIVKDALVIAALFFVGIAIPVRFYGSPAGMFDALVRMNPQHLILGAPTSPKGTIWFVSTVLLTGIGFFFGAQSVAATFSARSDTVLRRNAALLPFYSVLMLLVFFAGFTALLVVPGLKGPAVDESFLIIVQRYYPAWVMGAVGGAGILCALVPSTALLLAAGSIVSKNIAGDLFGLAVNDRHRLLATRLSVVLVGLVALLLWIVYKTTLVSLLLFSYNLITQFAPAIVSGFLWKRTNLWGAAAGIVCSIALALYLTATNTSPWGCNPGFIALVLNVILVVTVSLATQPQEEKEPAVTAGS